MYFRVEDENGIFPNFREYGWDNSYNTPINACDADALIANEIRSQVNNCSNRSVFSYSKSLGIALFKYNYITDNPIHLIRIDMNNSVEIDVIDDNGDLENFCIPYYITNSDYPIKQCFGNKKIILKNYCIDVDNDIQLDDYLRIYTKVGKKKIAACEKDREVIIRHVVNDYIITEHIDAVYLIYALQYETRFLNDVGVVNNLIKMFNKNIEDENEFEAFRYLVLYLHDFWEYEHKISENILQEKRKQGRIITYYDIYFVALDIMDGNIEDARSYSGYYLPQRMLSEIWNIFRSR